MIDPRKLVAPREPLGVLVEPDAGSLLAALRPDSQSGAIWANVRILDQSLADLRAALRQRLKWAGPVVLTGHQAEFFHAGVFAKNIAAHALARRAGGTAAFLSVDSDVPKALELAVPQATAGGPRRVHVTIPGLHARLAMEAQPRVSRENWLDFFTRIASLWEPYYDLSLLRPFANAWLAGGPATPDSAASAVTLDFCEAMDRARLAVERILGLEGIRTLRASRMCGLPEFRMFAGHLFLNAARFARDYNEAQAAYRRRHRVRTAQRPVPPLTMGAGRVELPFWILDPAGARYRLHVAPQNGLVELFADTQRLGEISEVQLAQAPFHADPWPLEQAGWRLRPRALALSAFMRLFLADVFLHGIGGAKYDEVTENFVQRFFGIEMPPLGCVTATLHLSLPHSKVTSEEIDAARRRERDVRHNPQRYVRHPPEELLARRAALIEQSQTLRAVSSQDRAARRRVFSEIHQVNEHILAADPWRAAELDQRAQQLEQQRDLDRIARDREYFFALHSQSAMEELVKAIISRIS